MFRHKDLSDKSKIYNLRYIYLCCWVINMIGFYHLGVLTTHVTGHFVFWGEAIVEGIIPT